ncbi:MAG TPA: lycopene beta-cyclase CrtY [Propionibacteriaceae bacterium]
MGADRLGEDTDVDLVILGGGLAGGLVALAVAARRPELRLMVVERARLGGNHIWSHFAGDVDRGDSWLVDPLVSYRWDTYDVAFPKYNREVAAPYRSITSERLEQALADRLPAAALVAGEVVVAHPDRVVLADGRTVHTRAVIDARGAGDLSCLDVGYQKFVGQVLHLEEPHGLDRPVVMDATVEQIDGYRFVYLLPLGPSEVFVEDTYYSDSPALDVPALKNRIADYARRRSWRITEVTRTESGVLPVVVDGDFPRYWASTGADLAKAGMRAGLFHPTTGYSLPDAIRLATQVGDASDFSHTALLRLTHDHASQAWKARRFYRLLDTMLFRAAAPEQRYRILQRHYQLDAGLVQRFYAAELTVADQARILAGRPPVAVSHAVGALIRRARSHGSWAA